MQNHLEPARSGCLVIAAYYQALSKTRSPTHPTLQAVFGHCCHSECLALLCRCHCVASAPGPAGQLHLLSACLLFLLSLPSRARTKVHPICELGEIECGNCAPHTPPPPPPRPSSYYVHLGSCWTRRQEYSLQRTFTQADVQAFADLTGDTNALHTDPEAAAGQGLLMKQYIFLS